MIRWGNILKFSLLSLGLMLSGCGGSDSAATTSTATAAATTSTATTNSTVSLTGVVVSVVDANSKPVSNVNVTIKSKATGVATGALATGAVTAGSTTDAYGKVNIASLAPGDYEMEFDDGLGGKKIKTTFRVNSNDKGNDVEEPKVIIGASQDSSGNLVKIDAIVASLSGNVSVFAVGTALEGVSVTLSSSKIGTISSGATNANGSYALLVNVAKKNLGALGDLTLVFSLDSYKEHKVTGLQVLPNTNVSGFDFGLTLLTAAEVQAKKTAVIQTYDFSNTLGWTSTGLWHQHTNGLNITNAAVSNGLVELAPNDTSAGLVPDAAAGNEAMWFGSATGANGESGNFLGASDTATNTVGAKNGGSSLAAVTGMLTSPIFDLTAVAANSSVSVTFDTWWEIESVNPNATGFDLMTIQYSVDNGTTWTDLARLNPLADPVTGALNRSPLPYSNNGFNASPSWVKQEAIPLVDPSSGVSLAGKQVQLRFAFDTKDSLYNGFRGWMIDNVEVAKVAGTFPVMDPYSLFVDPTASQGWDWMGLAWNSAAADFNITPVLWDSAASTPTALAAGTATLVSGSFEYEASSATQAQLAFSIDAGLPKGAPSSLVSLTAGGLQTVTMSANVTPTLGNSFVAVWVQMLNASGVVVAEIPVASYAVQ